MSRILIIEDDAAIVEGLIAAFEFHGYTLITAMNGEDGIAEFISSPPDLAIVDVMLPDIDGFDICSKLKSVNKDVPVIFLTAKNQESDKLLGFQLGADDYVTKPFSARELIARVKVHLRKSAAEPELRTVHIGSALVNFDDFTVEYKGDRHTLSPKEKKILQLLYNNRGVVVSRDKIIDEVWGQEYDPSIKTIDNFIGKLRRKIEDNPGKPVHIINVFGAGFKLIV